MEKRKACCGAPFLRHEGRGNAQECICIVCIPFHANYNDNYIYNYSNNYNDSYKNININKKRNKRRS